MRCDEARRRLLVTVDDAEACEHLAGCEACFAALEAADPVVSVLRGARPDDVPAPASLAPGVLARWPGRWWRRWTLTGLGLVAAAVLAGLALELAARAVPGWPILLAYAATAVLDGAVTWLGTLAAFRMLLVASPNLLAVFGALTLVVVALWVRVAVSVPSWRSAR